MGTVVSRAPRSRQRRATLLAAAAVLVTLAGCGARTSIDNASRAPRSHEAFAWLHPASKPHGWQLTTLPGRTAALSYPPRWRAVRTDPGTASAALIGRHGLIVAYLNATPAQGGETLANWSTFRAHHLAEEGSRHVRQDAAATRHPFAPGRASCVSDTYSTSVTEYREIACLVAGRRATTVIVGAAQSSAWHRESPVIERAINSFTT